MSNLIPVGPWCVAAPLPQCAETGKPLLSLRGTVGHWVGHGEQWTSWHGTEDEAKELARLYGGHAVPNKWVDPRTIPQRQDPRHPKPHAHDRTGEEIE